MRKGIVAERIVERPGSWNFFQFSRSFSASSCLIGEENYQN